MLPVSRLQNLKQGLDDMQMIFGHMLGIIYKNDYWQQEKFNQECFCSFIHGLLFYLVLVVG